MEAMLNKRPWLIPVALAILTIILLRPVIWPPEAGQVLDGQDFKQMFYPLQTFNQQMLQAGELPLWNPYMFLGVPHIGNPHASLFYPGTWLVWLIGVQRGIGLVMVLHTWLGAWGMAAFMRRIGSSAVGALLAGVIFAMSGWIAARYYAGHFNLQMVSAWIPWALVAYLHALRRGTWGSLLPGVGVIGLALLAGYTPLMVYMGLILACLGVYHALREEEPIRDGWYAGWRLAAIFVGGALLAAALILPTFELTRLATRESGDLAFANEHALPPAQYLSSLLLPDLYGNPKVDPYRYWGADFYEEYGAYAGLLPLLAIPLAFRFLRREMWLFLGMIGFGLVWSIGLDGALLPLFVRWVPGFGYFRVPARGLLLVVIGMAGLTAFVITELQTRTPDERRAALTPAIRLWLPVGIALAFVLSVFFSGWYASASHVEPMPLRASLVAGALAKAGVIGCGIWLALWLWSSAEERAIQWALRLTVIIIVLDAWHVAIPLITVDHIPEAPVWTGARTNIPAGTADRVLLLDPALGPINGGMIAEYPHVVGYDSLSQATFDDLKTLADEHDPTTAINTIIGVNYVLSGEPYDNDQFELIGIAYDSYYYARKSPTPRVWFPAEISVEPNDAAVRAALIQPNQNLLAHAWVDAAPGCEGGSGTATITEYRPNDVTITTESDGGLLVFSDQYYPGWHAEVDGAEVDIVRADTVFRAVCVPPGEHTVAFAYRPLSLYVGMGISAVSWAIWLVLGGLAWFSARRQRSSGAAVDERTTRL